ncbi:XopZ family type III secretion system effector [Xanthomonas euvesicatoria pv. eucalypti]|uniref:XopZ family type III secretion system effector n=2 Tax=Xanthomonas euvesicatoria TaxID=456327 RepID=UPI0026E16305|nr:XopZ family type III secretion system effector [Xanthomonas euvesicatoria]MDO7939628.1 XopZ family type III secretion system effector [Xanthomonas euvesicatoria pv. eucalypti]MDO7944150.1 XopZ family type III secretion system effector [Xanthomonas euvesicatoria pv. eucalypti]MDO7951748.1 XopZ family type III secretion system effector [Xanthomonas euvesicatoria pv. eucalypti]
MPAFRIGHELRQCKRQVQRTDSTMPRIPLRPSVIAACLPGMAETIAHPSKPSARRQTHNKLATPDPCAFEAELIQAQEDPLGWSATLLEQARQPSVVDPGLKAAPKRKHALPRPCRKAAERLGLSSGSPEPHTSLLRYSSVQYARDTPAGPSDRNADAARDLRAAPLLSNATQHLNEALIARLEQSNNDLAARICRRRQDELSYAHAQTLQAAREQLALRARRAANLSDSINALTRERAELLQQLHGCNAQTDAVAAAIHDLESDILSARAALNALPHDQPSRGFAAHAGPSSADAQQGVDRLQLQRACTRLEHAVRQTRARGDALAKAVFFGRGSAQAAQAEQALAEANAEIDRLRSAYAQARDALQSDQAGNSANRPASRTLGSHLAAERNREVEALRTRLGRNENMLTLQRTHAERCRRHARRLQQRLDQVEAKLQQARHSSRINTEEVWQHEQTVNALEAANGDMQRVAEHAAAQPPADEARPVAAEIVADTMDALLEVLPGFREETIDPVSRQVLRAWADALHGRSAAFGSDALQPVDALRIALQALAIASEGDAAAAADVLRRLGVVRLRELIPRPQVSIAAEAAQPMETVTACVGLLASVPRGMQVLSHMLREEATPPSREWLEAAQVHLRASHRLALMPDAEQAERSWLGDAQMGARHAVHGDSPLQGLQSATDAQRSAFHAFRNGYETTRAGSPYARVNACLQMFAQWAVAGSGRRGRRALNPFNALELGMKVGASEALPTAVRRANDAFREAAGHLTSWLVARRQIQLAGWRMPSQDELAMQALLEYVQWLPHEQNATDLTFTAKVLGTIERRAQELQRSVAASVNETDDLQTAACHPAIASAWGALRSGRMRLPETLRLIQRGLLDHAGQPSDLPVGAATLDEELASDARTHFHQAIGHASRLLHEGDTSRVRSPRALFECLRNLMERLEWRDKLRLTEQRVIGLNTTPLSAALAIIPSGLGLKLSAGGQTSSDRSVEIYMGRTGLSLQIGRQKARQFNASTGISAGVLLPGTEHAPVGITGAAEWRMKKESGIEHGVQIRVPRRGKGQELEQRAQFLAMFEHLLQLAEQSGDDAGQLSERDFLGELLAHHPSITVGLIGHAERNTSATESSLSVAAGVRVGNMDGQPRRATLGASLGVKARRETSRSQTPIEGYMTMVLKDSSAQSRVEIAGRASASVVARQWTHPGTGNAPPTPVARLSMATLDLGYSRELRSAGSTTFSTLWMFNNEIDPVRTDRGFEFFNFASFEREVKRNWQLWTHYGISKLQGKVDDQRLYMVAERQLQDFIDRVRLHMQDNKFASLIVDWVLQAEAAPRLDALRAQAQLLRVAGCEAQAAEADRAFDELISHPSIWEPTILILREKGKRQRERGLDFFIKRQTNQAAEASRTVGQWIPYEPVP